MARKHEKPVKICKYAKMTQNGLFLSDEMDYFFLFIKNNSVFSSKPSCILDLLLWNHENIPFIHFRC